MERKSNELFINILMKDYEVMRSEIRMYIGKYYLALTAIIALLTAGVFKENENKHITDILDFLGISPNFHPDIKIVNKNKSVRFRFIYNIIQSQGLKQFFWKILPTKLYFKIKKFTDFLFFKYNAREPIAPEMRNQLMNECRNEVVKLNDLLNKEGLINVDLLKLWKYE